MWKLRVWGISVDSPLNPISRRSVFDTTKDDVTTERSVSRRVARFFSLMLVVSERSVPTHSHFESKAMGFKVSRSTVFPTPRRPVRTMFSRTVSWPSSLRNSRISGLRPAKKGGICPAPGLNGFLKRCCAAFIKGDPPGLI